jgi:WD40 repeat protein
VGTRSGNETWLPADGTAIRSVAWSETARALASGSEDGTVHVWYRDTGRNIRLPEQHREGVYSVAWSADGGLLASGSNDGAIKFWPATPQGVVRAGEFTDAAQRKQAFALGWGGSDLLAIGRQDWQIQLVRVTL